MASYFSKINPTPSFPSYTGPYSVGTVDVEIPTSDLQTEPTNVHATPPTVAFRCFYPCQSPENSTKPVRWIQSPQRQIVHAYARFVGAGSSLSSVLSYFPHLLYFVTIPALRNVPILPSPQTSKRWPVVIFSHGLGGSRNAYSYLCGSLASHGLVVIAPDHRDGSSPVSLIQATSKTEAETIEYHRYSHKPSPEVYAGRDEQLATRITELGLIHSALLKVDAGEKIQNLGPNHDRTAGDAEALSMFCGALDIHRPGSITFAGHSFGAATTVQFVKSIFYSDSISTPILPHKPSAALKAQITPSTPTILLDLWGLPINSPNTATLAAKPMPAFSGRTSPVGTPPLTILSEAFFKWRGNLADVKRALADPYKSSSSTTAGRTEKDPSSWKKNQESKRPQSLIFYPISSAHLSQSDFGILFPTLTKYFAKADEPVRTLTLNVRAILEVLRRADVPVAATSAEDMEAVGAGSEKGEANSGRGDWRILSREEGVVRGWIALGADDEDGVEKAASMMSRRQSFTEGFGDAEVSGATVGDGGEKI